MRHVCATAGSQLSIKNELKCCAVLAQVLWYIVIALDEMHSSAALSFLALFV